MRVADSIDQDGLPLFHNRASLLIHSPQVEERDLVSNGMNRSWKLVKIVNYMIRDEGISFQTS